MKKDPIIFDLITFTLKNVSVYHFDILVVNHFEIYFASKMNSKIISFIFQRFHRRSTDFSVLPAWRFSSERYNFTENRPVCLKIINYWSESR